MNPDSPIIEIQNLSRRYGKHDAVNGLSLNVRAGKCYGFFGRNGAGKTTTIKCLLNLLRPDSGAVRVFGLDPQRKEVAVKSRLAYVPDMVAFYPWMTVRDTLEYFASFRQHWNRDIENDLLNRFQLDPAKKTTEPFKRPAHATRTHRRDLSRTGTARAGRADERPRPDCPPRIHRDRHWRVSIRRSRPPHGICLHASDL